MLTDIPETLNRGGPALWAIAALSIITVALVLWKTWALWRMGAWRRARARAALAEWQAGRGPQAIRLLSGRSGVRARVLRVAMQALGHHAPEVAREECARAARAALHEARAGLRGLDLIVAIAPLIGLLGTVLGMIEAFQALQGGGSRADPAALAGGIWEALLTTAAGMAVAIPASVALSWFDSVAEALAHDLEDLATRVFILAEAA